MSRTKQEKARAPSSLEVVRDCETEVWVKRLLRVNGDLRKIGDVSSKLRRGHMACSSVVSLRVDVPCSMLKHDGSMMTAHASSWMARAAHTLHTATKEGIKNSLQRTLLSL